MILKINDIEYIISIRKKATKAKAKMFLLKVENGIRKYISSLYPTAENDVFRFDYEGSCYLLDLKKCRIYHCT